MNYRHAYHAGNFADVIKHIVLLACLDYLQRKDGPLCILDAHGGAGIYDLEGPEAAKTGEWRAGVGRLLDTPTRPPILDGYLQAIEHDIAAMQYPGSPLLIARRLRPQDRLLANELHPATFQDLRNALNPYPSVRTTEMDAYQFIRAHIPPAERRGLVLVDPPFELKTEFEMLIRQMHAWMKRWATGVYIVWYPIKSHLPVGQFLDDVARLGIPQTWLVEIFIRPPSDPEVLTGCGVLVFNTPYTIPERVEDALPALTRALALDSCRARLL